MRVGATTVAMAERRGLSLSIWEPASGETRRTLEISGLGEDEYDAAYWVAEDGLHYRGTCLSEGPLEDVPVWIPSERALRDLLGEFSRQILKR